MDSLQISRRIARTDQQQPVQEQHAKRRQNKPGKKDEGIKVYYNDVYKPSIKENEQVAKNDPNSPEKRLVQLINSARVALDGSFYDIDAPLVVDALIRAKQRGVQVRIVTDSDNLVEKNDPTKSRAQVDRLKAAGIPVLDDKRSGLMHNKFLVVDHKIVWTGSTNLTPGSLYHHNNDAIQFNSPQLAADYEAEFERLFSGHFSKTAHDIPYPEVDVGGIKVKPFFSPNGNGLPAVLEELRGARKSIKFMAFSLSDKQIGEILIDKARQGLKVEGVLDTRLAANEASLYPVLREAGIPVYRDGNEALLHHKVIIIDDSTVITGSYNFSNNAEKNNNENFVIMKNAREQARKYLELFDKTMYAAKHNRPPYPKPEHPAPPQPKPEPTQLFPGKKSQEPVKLFK